MRVPNVKADVKVPFSIGLPATFADEIDTEALRLERSRSFLAEKLMARGWAAYKRDGQLNEPNAETAPLSVVREKLTKKAMTKIPIVNKKR